MPRGGGGRSGRSPSPSYRTRPGPAPRATPSRVSPTQARQTQPVPVQARPPASVAAAPQQPSLFGQMAATAGGVAVGSAIGHTVGHAVTGMFAGGSDNAEAAPVQQAPGETYQERQPCAWELKEFLQCTEQLDDISLCSGFNEAYRQCKQMNGVPK